MEKFDMRYEINRFRTFEPFKNHDNYNVISLATIGAYVTENPTTSVTATDDSTVVKCFFCKKIYSESSLNANCVKRHFLDSPKCPIFFNYYIENFPIDHKRLCDTLYPIKEQLRREYLARTEPMLFEHERLKTFNEYKQRMAVCRENLKKSNLQNAFSILALCGFYFDGIECYTAKCYFCKHTIDMWEATLLYDVDELLEKHSNTNIACPIFDTEKLIDNEPINWEIYNKKVLLFNKRDDPLEHDNSDYEDEILVFL